MELELPRLLAIVTDIRSKSCGPLLLGSSGTQPAFAGDGTYLKPPHAEGTDTFARSTLAALAAQLGISIAPCKARRLSLPRPRLSCRHTSQAVLCGRLMNSHSFWRQQDCSPDLPSNCSSLRDLNCTHSNYKTQKSPVSVFIVTTSPCRDWVICAPAAFLGCGSRFSGSLSGIEPYSKYPTSRSPQPRGLARPLSWGAVAGGDSPYLKLQRAHTLASVERSGSRQIRCGLSSQEEFPASRYVARLPSVQTSEEGGLVESQLGTSVHSPLPVETMVSQDHTIES